MLFSKQTPAAGGTAFAQFDAAWCYNGNGYIFNDTGTSLDVRIGASGSIQTVASGKTLPIALVFSMAELYVRRTDQSTTQVTVEATVGLNAGGAEGGGSGGGLTSVASTDITDASATGRAVLTGTPAQGRAALEVSSSYINRRTTTGNIVLTYSEVEHQRFVLDADRDITLPAESTTQWRFLLCNVGAAYNFTVKRAGGTTVGVVIPGGVLAAGWDGTGFGTC